MRAVLLALLVLSVWIPTAPAQSPTPPITPPVAPPPAIAVSPAAERPAWKVVAGVKGKLVRLTADKAVRWVLAEETVAEAAAELEPSDDGKRCAFVASADGRFKIIAYGADGGEASRTVVVVGDAPPDPKKPDPVKPDPVKPDPVKPEPPKPDPVAELRVKLQAAYTADGSAAKAESLKALVELYRQAGPIAADPAIVSTLALAKRLQTISASLVQPGQLAGVRSAIAEQLGATLGQKDAPLTPELRTAAADLFARIHKALGEVK
ncbi:MAG: hypothetical protein KF873_01955 [Gemmataceae bacterium]|nr:hypothetical protein [Gemmataceae bacterium]